MTLLLDKTIVGRNFGRAAADYDRWADAQRHIADHLDAILAELPAPQRILEWGCGTGYFSQLLHQRFGLASLLAIDLSEAMIARCRSKWQDSKRVEFRAEDAETFVPHEAVDLVAGSCCTQWFANPRTVAAAAGNASGPGAYVALAAPVAGSLPELKLAYTLTAGGDFPGLTYQPAQAYAAAFKAQHFHMLHFSEKLETVWRPDAWSVLRSLRGIGATFTQQPDYRPMPRRQLQALLQSYDARFSKGEQGVSLTYNIMYLIAQKC